MRKLRFVEIRRKAFINLESHRLINGLRKISLEVFAQDDHRDQASRVPIHYLAQAISQGSHNVCLYHFGFLICLD